MKIQLDADLQRRIRETFHAEEGSKFGIHRQQDVQPVLEAAKAKREQQDGMRWGEGKHVAYIPDIFVERMMRDPSKFPDDELAGILWPSYRVRDERRWKAWLNDSSNELFRTFGGRV